MAVGFCSESEIHSFITYYYLPLVHGIFIIMLCSCFIDSQALNKTLKHFFSSSAVLKHLRNVFIFLLQRGSNHASGE